MDYSQVYADIVAGAIPRAKTDPAAAIPLVAGAALQANRVHSMHTEFESMLYYIAVSSTSMSSAPDFHTPLAAALPGHPEHQGDGAYQMDLGPFSAAILKSGVSMRYLYNTTEAVDAALAMEGVPIFNVNQSRSWAFESVVSLSQQAGHKIGSAVLKASSVWAVLFTLIAVSAMVYGAWVSASRGAGDEKSQLNNLLDGSAFIQPMNEPLSRLQTVSSVAVRAGGWIERYRNTAGVEEYLVWLPAWVSRDYIEALGVGVMTEYDHEANMVIAYKGAMKRKK